MHDVRLTCYSDGRDADIEARTADFIGYTPMQAKGRRGGFRYDLIWHDKAVGQIWTEIEKRPTSATLRRTVEFRIGKLGNLGSAILTGYWAPCAWMSIEYTLWSDGRSCPQSVAWSIPSAYSGQESQPTIRISGYVAGGGPWMTSRASAA